MGEVKGRWGQDPRNYPSDLRIILLLSKPCFTLEEKVRSSNISTSGTLPSDPYLSKCLKTKGNSPFPSYPHQRNQEIRNPKRGKPWPEVRIRTTDRRPRTPGGSRPSVKPNPSRCGLSTTLVDPDEMTTVTLWLTIYTHTTRRNFQITRDY